MAILSIKPKGFLLDRVSILDDTGGTENEISDCCYSCHFAAEPSSLIFSIGMKWRLQCELLVSLSLLIYTAHQSK